MLVNSRLPDNNDNSLSKLTMERRTFDSPMDFEYNDRQARVPPDSPWLGGTKTLFNQNNFKSPTRSDMPIQASKVPNNIPQTPIRNHVASFRDNPALDFSSGTENPSSPENADNEDTPDVRKGAKPLSDNVTMFRGNHNSPSKGANRPASPVKSSARSSISKWVSRFSPSHKSLVLKDHSRHTGPGDRPHKRKRRELEKDAPGQTDSEYDTDTNALAAIPPRKTDSPRKTSRNNISPPPTELGTIPAILKFIHDHPGLPHILSWWAQMVVSTIVMTAIVYIAYSFWSAIRRDIDLKVDELSQGLIREMAMCTEAFMEHQCMERAKLGTKFKILCDDWETCMKQDPRAVGWAKISAGTWAEILNGFVEPLSGKIIFLGVSLFTISIAFPHILFGLMRRKDSEIHPPNVMRTPSNSNFNPNPYSDGQEQYFTPMHNRNYDAFSGQGLASGRRSPSKELRGYGDGSPVRRIQYR